MSVIERCCVCEIVERVMMRKKSPEDTMMEMLMAKNLFEKGTEFSSGKQRRSEYRAGRSRADQLYEASGVIIQTID